MFSRSILAVVLFLFAVPLFAQEEEAAYEDDVAFAAEMISSWFDSGRP